MVHIMGIVAMVFIGEFIANSSVRFSISLLFVVMVGSALLTH